MQYKNLVTKKCLQCEKTHSNKKFCSYNCMYKYWKNNKLTVFYNPKLRSIVSIKGGKTLVKINRKLKRGPFFNEKLRNEISKKGAWHNNELRLKNIEIQKINKTGIFGMSIEKRKQIRAKQIFPFKDSSIEIKIQNFLKVLNIEYFTHQYRKEIEHSYQCDIFIPSLNLVIECDGNYWHSYPIGNEIDHIRTKELLEKGFKVLRLWEVEIKELDVNGFKELIYNIK